METGSGSAVQFLLIILAAPVLLVGAAYGAVFWLRKKTIASLAAIEERLHGFDNRLGGMHHFMEEYSGINEEPYTGHLSRLNSEVGELQTQVEEFLGASLAFSNEVQSAGFRRLQDIINAPFDWLRRWQKASALLNESQRIEEHLSAADRHICQINELPWELAEQCQKAEKEYSEVSEAARALQTRGVRGQAMQNLTKQLPVMRQALDAVPRVFLEKDQETVLAGANEDDTIRAFDVLGRVQPALARYLPMVREWSVYHAKAAGAFEELKQAGAALRQAVTNPPAGLLVSDLHGRLDQIAQMAGDIGQRLQEPNAEDLKAISREVAQLRKVIDDTGFHLDRSRQQSGELSQSIGELNDGLSRLAGQFAELERPESHPLAWDESGPMLASLRRRLEALGPAQQPRTPEEVARGLKEVKDIRAGYETLAERQPRIAGQYRTLVALLDNPELSTGAAWLRHAREMLANAAQYDPRNWPRQDALSTLPGELDSLAAYQEQNVPVDRAAAIKESDLPRRCKDTESLAAQHRALRPRVESVRARLEKVQAMETEGKDKLTAAYTALDRVSLLTESNDMLYEITRAEIERLSQEVEQAGEELNARDQGEMEKKLRRIDALAEKVNRAMNGWVAKLNDGIREQGRAMNDRLIQIDSAGRLDEQPVIEAHSLLSRDEYLSAQNSQSSTAVGTVGRLRSAVAQRGPQLSDLEATAEIKRKSDFWLIMLSTARAVEERTGTLLAAYQEAVDARNEAREMLAEVIKRVPAKRSWPPNNQSPQDEAQLLKPIDERWEGMKTGMPRRIEAAILELGRLTQQYRLATERAGQILARVEQDEERVKDLVEGIEDLKRRWQAQAQADPNNQVMRAGIQHLMGNADSRMSYIRQQYIRGAISYEETIHNLRLLNDELFTSRVPIDEQNDIGLNEPPRQAHNG